ncbi:hypothetical protein A2U01_0064060, partial [Trifolium medium]|nr:hypothetical protein [Trifolium medium]
DDGEGGVDEESHGDRSVFEVMEMV